MSLRYISAYLDNTNAGLNNYSNKSFNGKFEAAKVGKFIQRSMRIVAMKSLLSYLLNTFEAVSWLI